MKRIFLSAFALGFILLAFLPAPVAALEYGGVGGKPANPQKDNPRTSSIFIYELEPGESAKDAVEVSNTTNETKRIKVSSVDSTIASDGAFACAQESETKADVGSWISIPNDTITLKSGAKQKVEFEVTAPDNASVGEHGGCITIQAIEDKAEASGGVVLSFRSAIRVSVTIPGDIVKAITISKVTLEPNSREPNKYIIQPSLTNSGNVSLDTAITTRLVSLVGIATSTSESTYPVLPGTTARWNFNHDSPFWGGWYKASVTATYNSNVTDGLGETNNQVQTSSSNDTGFIFIAPHPIALLIEILVIGGFIVALILLTRRLKQRRIVENEWVEHTVTKKDSLEKLAKRHDVSWKKIASVNKIRAPYQLEPGSKIKLPRLKKKSKSE